MRKYEPIVSQCESVYNNEEHAAVIMRDDDKSGAGRIIVDIENDIDGWQSWKLAEEIARALNFQLPNNGKL